MKGDLYKTGNYTDEWGCVFHNLQEGIQGEVVTPVLPDLCEWRSVHPPYELLPTAPGKVRDKMNRFCDNSEQFVFANICPRPWERYQFLRRTENALIDLMAAEKEVRELLRLIHEFFLKEMEIWVKTDVDDIRISDDWGSQHQLLIPPCVWRELFKPLYWDYCQFASSPDKFVFMHSDGYISEIYEDLIEIGVDAINSELFCMDIEALGRRLKGKLTFRGEIDRQRVLPSQDSEVGREAVRTVARHLYDPAGGIIAQFEFGPGTHSATAFAVFQKWEQISARTMLCPNDS